MQVDNAEMISIILSIVMIIVLFWMKFDQVLYKLKDIEWELKKLNRTPPTFGQKPEKEIKAVLDDSMTWRVDE